MMPADDTSKIYDLLEKISSKLDAFRTETEKRLAVLEERNSSAKSERLDDRLSKLEQFQSKAGVYMALAAALGGTAVGVVLKLAHLG